MVPGSARQRLKWKLEEDAEEPVQPKWLKPEVKVLGLGAVMRPQLNGHDILLEHSKMFECFQEVFEYQLKEM